MIRNNIFVMAHHRKENKIKNFYVPCQWFHSHICISLSSLKVFRCQERMRKAEDIKEKGTSEYKQGSKADLI